MCATRQDGWNTRANASRESVLGDLVSDIRIMKMSTVGTTGKDLRFEISFRARSIYNDLSEVGQGEEC